MTSFEGRASVMLFSIFATPRQSQPIPSTNTRKGDMIEFLQMKGVNLGVADPKKLTKTQLLQLVRQGNYSPTFAVDEVLREHGISAVRLPPYHCFFNPIEFVWATMKHRLRKGNVEPTKIATVRALVGSVLDTIGPDLWKRCIAHVKKEETKYTLQSPVVIDDALSRIRLDDDSDDERDSGE
jgi:hypothetical protein